MVQLSCDICGGKLVGRPGGVFECSSCGIEYSLERVREKLGDQDPLNNNADKFGDTRVTDAEVLVEYGRMALKRKAWTDAEKYFKEALELDYRKSEAYIGLALAGWEMPALEDPDHYEWATLSRTNKNYRKALQYAAPPLVRRLITARQKAQEKLDKVQKQNTKARNERAAFLRPVRERIAPAQHLISASNVYTAGVKADGTVQVVGAYSHEQSKIKEWKDIIAIAVGGVHTVGLRSDGTVVTTGDTRNDICDLAEWKDVTAISAGYCHTVALMKDGTVAALGQDELTTDGQCDVWDWHHIVAVSAGSKHTVGLRENGSVIAVGNNQYGQCNVRDWSCIVAVSAGHSVTLGLRSDGTVLAAGMHGSKRCEVENWRDIVAISAGVFHTVGLKADGTVIAEGNRENDQCRVGNWRNIVAIAAGRDHTVGLRSDGTLVSAGFRYHQDHRSAIIHGMNSWKLFNRLSTLEQERIKFREAVTQP